MRLVKFTGHKGQRVAVNPDGVFSVEEADMQDKKTLNIFSRVQMKTGVRYELMDHFGEVVSALEG